MAPGRVNCSGITGGLERKVPGRVDRSGITGGVEVFS